MQKLTRTSLHELRDRLNPEIKMRIATDKKASIIIGMGDSVIKEAAAAILTVISNTINSSGLRGDVAVIQTEKIQAPNNEISDGLTLVEIIVKDMQPIVYCVPSTDIAQKIVKEHIMQHNILNEYMLSAHQIAESTTSPQSSEVCCSQKVLQSDSIPLHFDAEHRGIEPSARIKRCWYV